MQQKLKFDNLFSDTIYKILEMAFRLCTSKSVTYSTEWSKPHLILNRGSFQMFILGHWKCKFAIWYCKYLCSIHCYFYHVFWHIFKFFYPLFEGFSVTVDQATMPDQGIVLYWPLFWMRPLCIVRQDPSRTPERWFAMFWLQKSVYAHSNSKHWNNFWWHKLS